MEADTIYLATLPQPALASTSEPDLVTSHATSVTGSPVLSGTLQLSTGQPGEWEILQFQIFLATCAQ